MNCSYIVLVGNKLLIIQALPVVLYEEDSSSFMTISHRLTTFNFKLLTGKFCLSKLVH